MIELSYLDLRNQNFAQAARKLASSTQIHDPRTLLNVAIIYKSLVEFWISSDTEWTAIVKEYEEPGQDKDENVRKLQPDRMDEYLKVKEEFEEKRIFISRPFIPAVLVAGAGLTPQEVIALEPLLDMKDV